MAGEGATKPRKFVALDVNEVSVVDRPAILREFLVAKRQQPTQEDGMAAFDANVEKKEGGAADAGATKEQDPKAAEGASGAAGSGGKEQQTAKGAEQTAKASCPKCDKGVLPGAEECPHCGAKMGAAGSGEGDKDKAKGAEEKKQKDLDGEAILDAVVDAVEKGRRFTPKRAEALKSGVVAMFGLVKELDPEGAKGVLEELSKELPKDAKAGQEVKPQGTGDGVKVGKRDDGSAAGDTDVAKIVEAAVTKAVKPVQERLEAIEKARTPSKAADGGGTDVPVKKSMWGGVL